MKKGFSLIELLAVIILLGVIAIIAVPKIQEILADSQEKAYQLTVTGIVSKTEDYVAHNDLSRYITANTYADVYLSTLINDNYIKAKDLTDPRYAAKVINKDASYVRVTLEDGQLKYTDYFTTESTTSVEYNAAKGVNSPKLTQGMTPIKWNGTTWVNTTSDDTAWYNYDTTNKIWANAKTADGSMWVWIPRYIYKISTNWHSNTTGTIDVQFSKGTDDNWNNAVIGDIDTGTTSNASNNKWTNHPAFKFGNTELTGIWVAKFQATASEGLANGWTALFNCPTAGDDVTTKTIKISPNVQSWRCLQVSNAFTNIRNMEAKSIYGWVTASSLQANGSFTTDSNNLNTHLMKNIEWGAAAYLSKSQYGKNDEEVYINNNQNYVTGCAGNTASETLYNGCQNVYDTANGVKASTTGNIYGIYDMSGGAWERMSAYVNNGSSYLTTYGASIISADNKYKDIYTKGSTDDQATNYGLTINSKGDAVYETSNNVAGSYSWFGDFSTMPKVDTPWFTHGGAWYYNTSAGAFNFESGSGSPGSGHGFRPIIVVGAGL